MKIIFKKYYEEFVKFLNSSCSYAVIILLFLGNALFSYTNPGQSSPYEFLKYMVTVVIGAMSTFMVQFYLKNKEQNRAFLNAGLAILRTIINQRNQLITQQKDFEYRYALLIKEKESGILITQGEDFFRIIQKIRGTRIIDIDVSALYKFLVSKSHLHTYANTLNKVDAWARRYQEIMEIILEINTLKRAFIKEEDLRNFDPKNVEEYKNVLRHHLPNLISQIQDSFDMGTICINDFQDTLRIIFGDIPELMGKDGGIEEVF